MHRLYFLLSCILFFSFEEKGIAQHVLRSVMLKDPRMMSTDESGNVYIISKNNQLFRYTQNGDSSGFYRSISNGDIGHIDATNPLRVLLYYPAFSKIIILDKMLSPKVDLDLKQINIFNPPAVGVSGDGRIWVYDPLNAQLKKIDDQLQVVVSTNDLRIETGEAPNPSSLLERDYKVYLVDSSNGIFSFDRYGSFINILPFKGFRNMQVVGSQLIYTNSDSLIVYDLRSGKQKSLILPDSTQLIDARVERNRMYFLYKDRLDIIQTED